MTEYLRCGFGGVEGDGGEVTMGGMVIPRTEKFKYLGSIVEEKGDIDEDINHRIRVGWQMEEGVWSTMWQEDPFQTKKQNLLDGSSTSLTLWGRMLANQEDSGPKVDGSWDENDPMDVWLY